MRHRSLTQRFIGDIELLSATPLKQSKHPPLLFVHGAFAHAAMWGEYYLDFFAQAGFEAHAVSLRGHGRSAGRDQIDAFGIRDYVDDLIQVVEDLGTMPVLLGHSMGGFVVQKFLEQHVAPAAVLMSSVPPQGLLVASFHLALSSPMLFMDFNKLVSGGDVSLEATRAALFVEDVDDEVLKRHVALMNQESQRAVWDMSMFNLISMSAVQRTPLLVIGTEQDRLIPAFLVQSTARAYGVRDHIFRDLGHGFPLEPGGERVAGFVVRWLGELLAA